MYRFFFILFFVLSTILKSQNIDHFELYELNNQSFLTVTISQGSTCDGIKILRSNDSTNFTQVGEIPGVCGSSAEAKSYYFTDENVEYNTTMYYKIQLGNFLMPNVAKIKIYKSLKGAVHVFPNPCMGQLFFVLDNKLLNTTQIKIYDSLGNKVIDTERNEKAIEINLETLNAGVYYYQLVNEQLYSGKFILN